MPSVLADNSLIISLVRCRARPGLKVTTKPSEFYLICKCGAVINFGRTLACESLCARCEAINSPAVVYARKCKAGRREPTTPTADASRQGEKRATATFLLWSPMQSRSGGELLLSGRACPFAAWPNFQLPTLYWAQIVL